MLCVCLFTLLNMNISVTRLPITIKFYLKHHLVGEDCISFGADRIRTLVSMATNYSHGVEMEKTVSDQSFFILVGIDDILKSFNMFKFGSDRAMCYGVSCP